MPKQWMLYSELADALGVKIPSAKQRARRNNWPIRTRNDGRGEVEVNLADLPPEQPKANPLTPKRRSASGSDTKLINHLETSNADLRSQLQDRDNQISKVLEALDTAQGTIADLQKHLAGNVDQSAEERRQLMLLLEEAQKPRRKIFGIF